MCTTPRLADGWKDMNKSFRYVVMQDLTPYSIPAMHQKFMVANGLHVQLGSFNYTSSANLRNAETEEALRNAPDLAS